MPPAALTAIQDEGILLARRGPELARLVCRWDTSDAEIDARVAAITRHATAAPAPVAPARTENR